MPTRESSDRRDVIRSSGHSRPSRTKLVSRGRRLRRRLTIILLCFVIPVAWSIGAALLAPGSDSAAARIAEWGRGHWLGFAVTWLEHVNYATHQPAVGGTPVGGIPRVAASRLPIPRPTSPKHRSLTVTHGRRAPSPAAPAPPAPLAAQLQPALPREGQWQTLQSVRGRPAIRATFLRPDPQHTSYLAGIAHMDQTLVRLVLHPGLNQPGGTGWSQDNQIPTQGSDRLLATFNSGFRLDDARGGYWQNGRQVGKLRNGAASLVILAGGRVDVRAWTHGNEVPRGVEAVRQNLDLLIDDGRISDTVASHDTRTWGRTIGNAAYVWRSGLGVRPDGSLVSVVGPALSVASLAHLLQDAGVIRAMELDINRDWTSFMTYTHPATGSPVPHVLTLDQRPDPYRYLRPSSRDFLAVYAR